MRKLVSVLLLSMGGCQSVPIPTCEKFTVYQAVTPQGPMYLLDAEEIQKLAAMVRGLSDGTCRLETGEQNAVGTPA